MENVNPSSPPESPTLPISRRVQELNKLLEPIGLVELFKEYEIGDVREEKVEELEEEEEEVEVEELGVEYFDKFPTKDELAYHKYLLHNPNPLFYRISPLVGRGIVRFTYGVDEVAYQMPHKVEQFRLLPNIKKDHRQSVYLRSNEDKRRGMDYVMKKMLGFDKECLELGHEYKTNNDGSSSRTSEGVT
ncbi:hypothetical protein Tco_1327413 [Tanacetum coccineum]